METTLVLVLAAGAVLALAWWHRQKRARLEQQLDDARAEASRWYERLGGQVYHLGGSEPAVRQALADAGERYNAAGAQLEQARTVHQCRLAQETALEGLLYVRAARVALGMDPGPELPPLAAARGAGELTVAREVEVEGATYKAGPHPGADTPYYYPGGRMRGRRIPAGWYSHPLWHPAAAGVAGAAASMLVFGVLLSPSIVDPGFASYGFGVDEGAMEGINAGTGDVHYSETFADPADFGFGGFDGGGFDGGGGDGGG
jgi:hypothetical protein